MTRIAASLIALAMIAGISACAVPGHPPGQWPDPSMSELQSRASPPAPSAVIATPAAPDPVMLEPTDALPPQTLAPGECGLFFWTSSMPHRLVLFENETRRAVMALHDGAVHRMGVTAQRADFLQGDAFRRLYLHEDTARSFTVSGEIGEVTASGPRIERGLIRVRERSGVEVVRPVIGLRSCRGLDGRSSGAVEAPGRVRG
ncbi:MAG: hypothetical protein AAFX09_03020 [Pseudomonadota bacterium]